MKCRDLGFLLKREPSPNSITLPIPQHSYCLREVNYLIEQVKGVKRRRLGLGGGAAGRRRVSTEPKNFRGEAADHGGSRGKAAGRRKSVDRVRGPLRSSCKPRLREGGEGDASPRPLSSESCAARRRQRQMTENGGEEGSRSRNEVANGARAGAGGTPKSRRARRGAVSPEERRRGANSREKAEPV